MWRKVRNPERIGGDIIGVSNEAYTQRTEGVRVGEADEREGA